MMRVVVVAVVAESTSASAARGEIDIPSRAAFAGNGETTRRDAREVARGDGKREKGAGGVRTCVGILVDLLWCDRKRASSRGRAG